MNNQKSKTKTEEQLLLQKQFFQELNFTIGNLLKKYQQNPLNSMTTLHCLLSTTTLNTFPKQLEMTKLLDVHCEIFLNKIMTPFFTKEREQTKEKEQTKQTEKTKQNEQTKQSEQTKESQQTKENEQIGKAISTIDDQINSSTEKFNMIKDLLKETKNCTNNNNNNNNNLNNQFTFQSTKYEYLEYQQFTKKKCKKLYIQHETIKLQAAKETLIKNPHQTKLKQYIELMEQFIKEIELIN